MLLSVSAGGIEGVCCLNGAERLPGVVRQGYGALYADSLWRDPINMLANIIVEPLMQCRVTQKRRAPDTKAKAGTSDEGRCLLLVRRLAWPSHDLHRLRC